MKVSISINKFYFIRITHIKQHHIRIQKKILSGGLIGRNKLNTFIIIHFQKAKVMNY